MESDTELKDVMSAISGGAYSGPCRETVMRCMASLAQKVITVGLFECMTALPLKITKVINFACFRHLLKQES